MLDLLSFRQEDRVLGDVGGQVRDPFQVPADQHEGVAHHHAPCADQHVGELGTEPSAYAVSGARSALLPERQSNAPGREPEADLRPPIA